MKPNRAPRFKKIIFFILMTGFILCGCTLGYSELLNAPKRKKVPNFKLLASDGRFRELKRHNDARAVVLIWQGNGCPIFRTGYPRLSQLQKKFSSKDVVFYLVNANSQDSLEEIQKEASEFDYKIPILKDDVQYLTKFLNVTRTMEAIIIDTSNWTVAYSGPVDDGAEYETQKLVTSHFLDQAIRDVLDKKTPEVIGHLENLIT